MGSPEIENCVHRKNEFGILRLIPEDCVEYRLYIIDSKLKSQDEFRNLYDAVLHESLEMTKCLLGDYIWNHEGFKLEIRTNNENIYLYGLTNYGDSLEDEWLIVYLLRRLSEKFQELWIRVADADGEFLLIEAASVLPRWLNPEIAENRVWINNNKLYLIPLDATCYPSELHPKDSTLRPLKLAESLQIIDQNPGALTYSATIEAQAFYRLCHYPLQISASLHYATVQIPRKLAYVLQSLPAAMSPAVEAFYLRDPVSLRLLNNDQVKFIFPLEDLIKMSVRFTKLRFAQLKSQQISIPLAWNKKLRDSEKMDANSYEQLKLGIKLTCGFEMLMKDPQYRSNSFVKQINFLINDIDVQRSPILLSDAQILSWNKTYREDDEFWMDIDFGDFERELAGKSSNMIDNSYPKSQGSGFGDAKVQADLRKIVERFESFLDDEKAGPDGVELDDTDLDDQDSFEDYSSDEDQNKDVTFNTNEFSRIIKEMIENPSTCAKNDSKPTNEDSDEAEEIMEQIEKELKEAGALNIDYEFCKTPIYEDQKKSKNRILEDENEQEIDEKLNIDFNLAKNILESIKCQEGLPSPASNLLEMMRIRIPGNEHLEETKKA